MTNTDNDRLVLEALYSLWPRLRLRGPVNAAEREAKDAIRQALETRFGAMPWTPRPALTEHVASFPERTDDGLEVVYNTHLVHGNALKRHAHYQPHKDVPFADHLHGPQSHVEHWL